MLAARVEAARCLFYHAAWLDALMMDDPALAHPLCRSARRSSGAHQRAVLPYVGVLPGRGGAGFPARHTHGVPDPALPRRDAVPIVRDFMLE
jgi:hypothetical protein